MLGCFILITIGCKKTNVDSTGLANTGVLQGTAYYLYYSPLGADTLILTNKIVYLQSTTDNNYQLTSTTDQYGHYSFIDLDTNEHYRIFTNLILDTLGIINIPYYSILSPVIAHANAAQQDLFAGVDTSGRINTTRYFTGISTVDDKGGRIGKVHVVLYYSSVVAQADSALSDTGLANFTSDETGSATVGLPGVRKGDKIYYRAKYFINAHDSLIAFNSFIVTSQLLNTTINIQ